MKVQGVGCDDADVNEEVEGSLEDIHDMTEVVIRHETVVSSPACDQKVDELVWRCVSGRAQAGRLGRIGSTHLRVSANAQAAAWRGRA